MNHKIDGSHSSHALLNPISFHDRKYIEMRQFGPSIYDVGKVLRFLTPTPAPPVGSFLLLSIGKFSQFLTPPKKCRRLKWMVPIILSIESGQ